MRSIIRVLILACAAVGIAATAAHASVTLAPIPTIVHIASSGAPTRISYTTGGVKTISATFATPVPQGHGVVCLGRSNEDVTGDLRVSNFTMSGGSTWNTIIPDYAQGGMRGMQRLVVFDKIAGASEPTTYTMSSTLVTVNAGLPAVGLTQSLQCYDVANANQNHVVGRVSTAQITPGADGSLVYPRQFTTDFVGTRVISTFSINQEVPITPAVGTTALDSGISSGAGAAQLSFVGSVNSIPVQSAGQILTPTASIGTVPPGSLVLGSFITLLSQIPPPSSGDFFQRRAYNSGYVQSNTCTNTTGIGSGLTSPQLAEFLSMNFGCVRGPSVGQPQSAFAPFATLCTYGMKVSLELNENHDSKRITNALIDQALGFLPSGCVNRFDGVNEPDKYGTVTSDPNVVIYTPVSTPVLSLAIGTGSLPASTSRCYVGIFLTYIGNTGISNEVCATLPGSSRVVGTLNYPATVPTGSQNNNVSGGKLYEGPSGGPYSYIANAGGPCSGSPCTNMIDDGSLIPDVTDQVSTATPNTSVDFIGMYTRDYPGWSTKTKALGIELLGESLTSIIARSVTPVGVQGLIDAANTHPYTYRSSPDHFDSLNNPHANCGAGAQSDPCASLLYEGRPAFVGRTSTEWGMNIMEPQATPCPTTGVVDAPGNCGNRLIVDTTVQAAYISNELFSEYGLRGQNGFYYYTAWDVQPNTAAGASNNYGLWCQDKVQEKPAATELKWLLSKFRDADTTSPMDALGYRFDPATSTPIPARAHSVLVQNPTTRVMYMALWNGVGLQPTFNGFNVGGVVFPAPVSVKLTVQNAPQPAAATYDEFQSSSGLPIVHAAPWTTVTGADGSKTYSLTLNVLANPTIIEMAPPADAAVQPIPSSFSTPSPNGYAPTPAPNCP